MIPILCCIDTYPLQPDTILCAKMLVTKVLLNKVLFGVNKFIVTLAIEQFDLFFSYLCI